MAHIKHEKSSQIFSTSYDPVEQTLEVRFRCPAKDVHASNGDCPKCRNKQFTSAYRYKGVPAEVYQKVRDADSVGSAFHSHIKNRPHVYPFEKLS